MSNVIEEEIKEYHEHDTRLRGTARKHRLVGLKGDKHSDDIKEFIDDYIVDQLELPLDWDSEDKTDVEADYEDDDDDDQQIKLHGIISLDEKFEKKNYKLHDNYDIKNIDFINELELKRHIVKQDLNKINWSNLTVIQGFKEYCFRALERVNSNNNNNLIPILVTNGDDNYYVIEWILMVHIIHQNRYIGVSFRYNDKSDVFIATAIYLDKEKIESRHKLIEIGMKRKMMDYKKAFEQKRLENNNLIEQIEEKKQYQLLIQILNIMIKTAITMGIYDKSI